MKRLLQGYRAFPVCSRDMRLLLTGNCLYAFVLPIIEIFVAAYVLRATQSAASVLLYQMSVYLATPIAFLITGYLLRCFPPKYLYAAGMFTSGAALLLLTFSSVSTDAAIAFCGAAMGLSTGLFWANGSLLAVASTNDSNRNFFYGVGTAALTFASVVVPWTVGIILERNTLPMVPAAAGLSSYKSVAVASILLTVVAAIVVACGRFETKRVTNFLAFRFHRLWYWLLTLAALRGITQGFILTAPALLILRMLGREGTLGRIEAIGGGVAAISAYLLGQYARPQHRVHILTVGVIAFWMGSLASGALFNALGTLIFMGSLIVAKPLIDLAYGPMEFRTIDVLAANESRNPYTYLMSHEFGVLAGRLAGCGLFLYISLCFSETAALRYVLPIVASLQLPTILVARKLAI